MISWDKQSNTTQDNDAPIIRAAQYVRMSTEHQKYSTDNQAAAIRRYADKRGYTIVKTYANEGKSGLRLDGRDGLQALLSDVENKQTEYSVVLVYVLAAGEDSKILTRPQRLSSNANALVYQSIIVPSSLKMTAASDRR